MTTMDPAQSLKDFQPRHEFFIGIDSDGSVFDTMPIKHRECICPAMIECFGLEPVAEAAQECMDFADLYSKTRGANRHKGLRRILAELLPGHPLVKARGFQVPQPAHYFAWVADPSSSLNRDGLTRAIARASSPARQELELALEWNDRANQAITQVVNGIPPFRFVRECLDRLQDRADAMVLSTAPRAVLVREWNEHDMARYVALIAGQEMGAKARCLECATRGRYDGDRVLMVGDAPGDLEAAKANGALFYPILPGDEAASWKRFHDEAMDRFFNGDYAGEFERALIAEFDSRLPEKPPWVTRL